MALIIFETTANVIATHAMISNTLGVMVDFVTFSETFTRGTRRVTSTCMAAPTAAIATATVPATVFRIGRSHDRQSRGQQRRSGKHHCARHNGN